MVRTYTDHQHHHHTDSKSVHWIKNSKWTKQQWQEVLPKNHRILYIGMRPYDPELTVKRLIFGMALHFENLRHVHCGDSNETIMAKILDSKRGLDEYIQSTTEDFLTIALEKDSLLNRETLDAKYSDEDIRLGKQKLNEVINEIVYDLQDVTKVLSSLSNSSRSWRGPAKWNFFRASMVKMLLEGISLSAAMSSNITQCHLESAQKMNISEFIAANVSHIESEKWKKEKCKYRKYLDCIAKEKATKKDKTSNLNYSSYRYNNIKQMTSTKTIDAGDTKNITKSKHLTNNDIERLIKSGSKLPPFPAIWGMIRAKHAVNGSITPNRDKKICLFYATGRHCKLNNGVCTFEHLCPVCGEPGNHESTFLSCPIYKNFK